MKVLYFIAGAAVVGAIILAFNWKKWFGTPDTSDYDKCLATNKTKADGADCTNCADPSSSSFLQGVIKNGICIGKTIAEDTYEVSEPQGAIIYVFERRNFISRPDHKRIPHHTPVKISGFSTNKDFANTDHGWMSTQDIGVISK